MHLNSIEVALKIWVLQRLKKDDHGKIRRAGGNNLKITINQSSSSVTVFDLGTYETRSSVTVLFSSLSLSLSLSLYLTIYLSLSLCVNVWEPGTV
jgi:hypothetical protein